LPTITRPGRTIPFGIGVAIGIRLLPHLLWLALLAGILCIGAAIIQPSAAWQQRRTDVAAVHREREPLPHIRVKLAFRGIE
jgi:hypothetical protein